MATGLVLVLLCIGAAVADVEHAHGGEKHKEVPRHEHYPDGEHDSGYDHDSILGSHKLEEEFSHLPPEEAKKRLRTLVTKMDRDGDGSVSRPELEEWVLQSFKRLDQEEASERFAEYDTTGDGRIDWPGYLQKVYGMDEEEIQKMERMEETEAFLDMTVDDRAKFNAADVNQDGYLDVKEFVAFEYPYDFPNMYEVEIDRTYRDLDKDKDAKLTFKEFIGDMEMADDEKIAQEEEFKQYDLDGDDHLSRSEALPWILPDNKRAAADEAEHLIGQTDTDNDGALSADEIVEQHELWVGSQATNYGKHLQDEL